MTDRIINLYLDGNKLAFDGDIDEFAKKYLEYLCEVFDNHLKKLIHEEAEKLDTQKNVFLRDHLKLWKDSGIPAPANEIQSIQAWLRHFAEHGEEETKKAMRNRMLLLAQAANKLHDEGPAAEDAAGIYDNRPDMRPENDN